MSLSRHDAFRPIDRIVADVLPALCRAERLPLRVSCLGTVGYDGADDADGVDRTVPLGQCPSPEEAMGLAALRVSRGDIRVDHDDALRFHPRVAIVHDSKFGLVLAGEIRAGLILWRRPVASDAAARRVVTEASRLRGMAFAASGRGERGAARDLRYRASLLEAQLVDPFWRATAAALLALPRAA